MLKVAMIGVGKLGEPCAEVMSKHYDVVGYDPTPRLPSFPMKDTIEEAVKGRDFIFIAAPTPHDPIYGGETPTSQLPIKDFDYTTVTEILKEVNKHVTKKQLVVLISTVLPGTVRTRLRKHITNARFIYNPYLIAMGTVAWDFINPEMVIIGTEDGSLTGDAKELIDFYKPMMQNDPRYEVGTWDEAESIKIFYNTFISTKIALVNMIQDVAEKNGNINVDVVTDALKKSTYRIMGPAYMKAGMGDAGACHPRDNIALRYLAQRLDLGYDLFDSIMHAREVQARKLAEKCLKYGKKITIIGKAYKPGVPYINGSYSLLVGHYIEELSGEVKYYDIHTGDTDLNTDWTDVYLIGYWEDWVEKLEWNKVFTKTKKSYTFVDPWRLMPDMKGQTVVHYGNTRTKLGEIKSQQIKLKGGVLVKVLDDHDNGSMDYKDEVLDYVVSTGKYSYNKAVEWASGSGILGFELLGMGVCNNIAFLDSHEDIIANCLETAKSNKLANYVQGHLIKKLPNEKWDLVIANPVQSVDKDFVKTVLSHITQDADIYLIEESYSEALVHMAKIQGLRFIGKQMLKYSANYPKGVILHFKP